MSIGCTSTQILSNAFSTKVGMCVIIKLSLLPHRRWQVVGGGRRGDGGTWRCRVRSTNHSPKHDCKPLTNDSEHWTGWCIYYIDFPLLRSMHVVNQLVDYTAYTLFRHSKTLYLSSNHNRWSYNFLPSGSYNARHITEFNQFYWILWAFHLCLFLTQY